jgi:hypothetical protein
VCDGTKGTSQQISIYYILNRIGHTFLNQICVLPEILTKQITSDFFIFFAAQYCLWSNKRTSAQMHFMLLPSKMCITQRKKAKEKNKKMACPCSGLSPSARPDRL